MVCSVQRCHDLSLYGQIVLKVIIPSFRLRDNSVHFHECSPRKRGYFYNMYIVEIFEIVFSFNVKHNNIL